MEGTKILAEYIGTGTEHLGGIPASDLTEEQVDALADDARTELLKNAASDHAIYKLRDLDLETEAKEIKLSAEQQAAYDAGMASGEIVETPHDDGTMTVSVLKAEHLPPLPETAYPPGAKPLDTSNVPKAADKPAEKASPPTSSSPKVENKAP